MAPRRLVDVAETGMERGGRRPACGYRLAYQLGAQEAAAAEFEAAGDPCFKVRRERDPRARAAGRLVPGPH